MARTEITETVTQATADGGLRPVTGATVRVYERGTTTPVRWYANGIADTVGSLAPIVTVNGRIEAWVPTGSYDLFVTYTHATYGTFTYTQPIECVAADDVADLSAFAVVDYTDGQWPPIDEDDEQRKFYRGGSEDDPPPRYRPDFDIWVLVNANVDTEIADLQGDFTVFTDSVSGLVDALDNRVADLESGTSLPVTGGYSKVITDDTFEIPTGVVRVKVRLTGAGGGGGGGGSAASTQLQAGGGGGAAGGVWEGWIDTTLGGSIDVVVGVAGPGGPGGNAGGNAGTNGTNGGSSSVAYGGTTIAAEGGGPGFATTASSTTAAFGGQYARNAGQVPTTPNVPGCGGGSNQGCQPMPPGVMGGNGGGAATATNGGSGGTASTVPGCKSSASTGSGGSGTSAGGNGTAATTLGCGGGGGGGGAAGTGKGGNGGSGAAGCVEIWW